MTPHLPDPAAAMDERQAPLAAGHPDPSVAGRLQGVPAHGQFDGSLQTREFETYFGFIATLEDALLVIEGTINGCLPHFAGTASELNHIPVRSGTVIVVAESSANVRRWKDGIPWSPSRAFGPFLLYRQIELETSATSSSIPHAKYSARRFNSNHAGLEPNYTQKTLKPGTRIAPNGLTKRTITLVGSDGGRHRLVSYYEPNDIVNLHQGKPVCARNFKTRLLEHVKLMKIPSDDPTLNAMLATAEFQSVLTAAIKIGGSTRSTSSVGATIRIPGIAEMLREATPMIQKFLPEKLDNAGLDQTLVKELRMVKPENRLWTGPQNLQYHQYFAGAFNGMHQHYHPYYPPFFLPAAVDNFHYARHSHNALPPAYHPSHAYYPVAVRDQQAYSFHLESNRGF
ncbi:Gti1/Pac2 family-domain-containing protein [Chytriomyces cf. hyalinus JEL632]|nr:Gti1/Pac2 family-domain-containing protein [Chytriomyces cf. hyalinus JEL632]